MDGSQFDTWTKRMASGRTSRQGVLRLAAGAGLAAVLGGAGAPSGRSATSAAPKAAAPRCRGNNRPCVVSPDNDCCSGFCKRISGSRSGRCRNLPEAQGCQIRDNSCAPRSGSNGTPCPGNRNGRCFTRPNGRPLCSTEGGCFNCDSDEDCNRRFDRQGGQCIDCPNCDRTGRRACIFN